MSADSPVPVRDRAHHPARPTTTSRGHSLAELSALPRPSELSAPRPSSPAASQPLQLLPNWKKLLAGAGAVLGTGALVAGGVLASPGLAVAGGLGLLAGGGYLAVPALNRHRENRRREGLLREASNAIRRGIGGRYRRDDTGRSAVLSRVLEEATGHLDNPNVRLRPTTGRGELAFGTGRLRDRNYEIRVNPDLPLSDFDPDPAKTRSTVLHELTHVAVDQSYRVNRGRGADDRPKNIRGDEDENEVDDRNYKSVQALRKTLANDPHIPEEERAFIDSRLDYANTFANTVLEHDTVVNELLYYFHQKGIPEHSETSLGITRLAHEAYLRRTT